MISRPHQILAELPPNREVAEWIDSCDQLARYCRCWLESSALGVDTEFVRERTFYPDLGLIQISDGQRCFLLDPIALSDLEPLRDVLEAPHIVKVFHSCAEDMEVLYHRFGCFPRPIFDTQIAASLVGIGHSLGYARMVKRLFSVEIPKGQTRSNWLRRPLSEAQKNYAASDVAYLPPSFRYLRDTLFERKRDAWASEEFERLADIDRFLPDPDQAYLKIRASKSLNRRELGHLRALCAWREREARDRNVPRNFILKESALVKLARRPAMHPERLATAGLTASEIRRYGSKLCHIGRKARGLAPTELPPASDLRINISGYQHEVDQLMFEVRQIADEIDVAPELLATRRAIETLVRRIVAGKKPPLPESLRGWRQEILERRLFALFEPSAGQGRRMKKTEGDRA